MSIHKSTFWGPFWAMVAFTVCVGVLRWVSDIPERREAARTALIESERALEESKLRLEMARNRLHGAFGESKCTDYGTECDMVLADSIVNGLGRWAAYKR